MNLKINVWADPNSAEFYLTVQAFDHKGTVVATIASFLVTDPQLGQRLSDIFQAYRMGTAYGQSGPVTYGHTEWTGGTDFHEDPNHERRENDATFPVRTDPALLGEWSDRVANAETPIAGSDVPSRDTGIEGDTRNLVPVPRDGLSPRDGFFPRDYGKY